MTRKSNYNHPLFQERAGERLKITLASYYHYWGDDMAELLDGFDEMEQRKIVHLFMDIISMGRWKVENNEAVVTSGVHHDFRKVISTLMNMYLLDIRAQECVKIAKRSLMSQ